MDDKKDQSTSSDKVSIDIDINSKQKTLDNKVDLLEVWLDYYAGEGDGKIGVLNLFSNYKENGCIFYPFSKGIPWKITENDSISQSLSDKVADALFAIYKKKVRRGNARKHTLHKVSIVLPGFLPECLIGAYYYNIMKAKGMEIFTWLTPQWYQGAMEFMGLPPHEDPFAFLDYFTDDRDIFDGFDRISVLERDYCAPIFFDIQDNIYFNALYNYKEFKHYGGLFTTAKNEKAFWRNILRNCCGSYKTDKPIIDVDKANAKNIEVLDKLKIDKNKKYVILDMLDIKHPYHNPEIVYNYKFSPKQIEEFSFILDKKNIQLLICIDKEDGDKLYGRNIKIIPKWWEFDSYELCCFLYGAFGVVSADPNLYLTASIFGVDNICVTTSQDKGSSINDVKDISLAGYSRKTNWIECVPPTQDNEIFDIKPFFVAI